MRGLALGALAAGVIWAQVVGAQVVGFDQVSPIFNQRCVKCHSGAGAPMGLDLASYSTALSGSFMAVVLRPGDAESPLLGRIKGRIAPRMPLDGPPFLSDEEAGLIEAWVMGGLVEGAPVEAPVLAAAAPAPGEPVLWPDVETIFLQSCVKCHSDNSKLGAPPEGVRLSALDLVLQGGERLVVVPGNPEMSPVWRHITGTARPRMPQDGPPWLSDEQIRLIHDWIEQGAKDGEGTPAPMPVGREIRLRGVLTGRSAIDGAEFIISGATRVDDRPQVGDQAEMRGVVQADGSVLATRFRDR